MASMEPLFFKAENPEDGLKAVYEMAGLQWSRFFSKRKITPLVFTQDARQWLQWSRFFSKRKIW